jgi:hypothetical protein
MKPIFKLTVFTFIVCCTTNASAQKSVSQSQSDPKGFWVIENNIHTPKNSIVYFYNENKELVYKESVTGKRININRRKTCGQLNTVLAQSLVSWEKEKVAKENQQWLAAKL